jgi:hypothetical protein
MIIANPPSGQTLDEQREREMRVGRQGRATTAPSRASAPRPAAMFELLAAAPLGFVFPRHYCTEIIIALSLVLPRK